MEISAITIIVPTKNEVKNLPRFLSSFPANIQLILVDASTDGTADLAYQLRKENTTVYQSQARIAEARNIGAQQALTSWLLFTDSDIIFSDDYFNHLTDIHPAGAVYGPKRSTDMYVNYYRSFTRWQSRLDRMGIPAVSGSNFLVEKEVFKAVGGFDPQLLVNEDTEIGYRLKRAGYPIQYDPQLSVTAFDHRRLMKGTVKKNIHTLARCLLIYLDIFPSLWRGRDWGYWSNT